MAAKDLLNSMNENAPGLKECEKAISILQENELDLDHALVIVEASNILPSRGDNDLDGFQEMMLAATQDVEAAADDIRNASVGQQSTLGKAVLGLANGFLPLTASCLVCANSSKIIMSMQTLSSDQNNSGAKLGLAHASRDLQKALDDLLNLCSTAGPGVRECDAGARSVAGLSGTVGDGDTPSNDMGYFDCLNTVKDRTAGMGRNMIEIPKAAGDGDK
eukprot:Pgem_evm1s14455